MHLFMLILLLKIFLIIFSIKTDIKFTLNVPSLFRCKKNGPVFYFRNFPTEELFIQRIKNSSKDCDLNLISEDKRVIFNVENHLSICTYIGDRINEILFFKSNCSTNDENDLCIRLTPTYATIITDYLTETYQPMSIDMRINGIGTENIEIGDQNKYPYSYENHGYEKTGVRIYYIVFKIKDNKYLNMMCRYFYINNPVRESSICRRLGLYKNLHQTRGGTMTKSGEGWSWLCYYYPSGVEEPLDYKMITKANEDSEKPIPSSRHSMLALFSFSNLTEFSNDSSMSLNEDTENNSSIFIVNVFILLIIVSGIFCIYKCKYQDKIQESDLIRSSLELQISITSEESIENEDDD